MNKLRSKFVRSAYLAALATSMVGWAWVRFFWGRVGIGRLTSPREPFPADQIKSMLLRTRALSAARPSLAFWRST